MYRLWTLCIALLLTACYDSSFGEAERVEKNPEATTTIAELRGLYAGTTYPIDHDLVITGRITTSDRSENFYRTLCIEHDGAGIEVMAGIDHLHNDYPVGCRVVLRLRGLALGESFGVLQAGRMPAPGSGFATDYIGSKAALDRHLERISEQTTAAIPTLRTIGTLTRNMCGALIRIEGVRYNPEGLEEGSWAGYARFTDDTGAEIFTYVRTYASFAEKSIPTGRVTLIGILQYDAKSGGRYLLKLRDETDYLD